MSGNVKQDGDDSIRRERDIELQLLQAAYGRLPLNMWLTLICTLIFVPLLWRFFPRKSCSQP